MNYEIVTLDEKNVVGISMMTTNENGESMKDIGALWQRFITEGILNNIQDKTTGKALGLYTDYEDDATAPYRFMCCAEVSTDICGDKHLEARLIPQGKYAKFTIKGDLVKSVGAAWQKIWSMSLDRAYSCNFELYHHDSDDMNNQTIDLYISIN